MNRFDFPVVLGTRRTRGREADFELTIASTDSTPNETWLLARGTLGRDGYHGSSDGASA